MIRQIEVRNMSIAVNKKTQQEMTGTNQKGQKWKLWKIIDENSLDYGIFMYNNETPKFNIGSRYEVEFDETQNGQYTNRTINLGSKRSFTNPNQEAILTVLTEIKEILLTYTAHPQREDIGFEQGPESPKE